MTGCHSERPVLIFRMDGQREVEGASFALLRHKPHSPAMPPDYARRDKEAEAQAGILLAHIRRSEEALEDVRLLVGRYAHTEIAGRSH